MRRWQRGSAIGSTNHWSTLLGFSFFGSVPSLSITVDSTRTESVDNNVLSRDDKTSSMILELYGIRVASPVREVVGELEHRVSSLASNKAQKHDSYCPLSLPLYSDISYNWIETLANPVCLTAGKHNSASVPALFERLFEVWNIVRLFAIGEYRASRASMLAIDHYSTPCRYNGSKGGNNGEGYRKRGRKHREM